MREYMKCVMANKFCLIGALMFFMSGFIFVYFFIVLDPIAHPESFNDVKLITSFMFLVFGFDIWACTLFGRETYGAYIRARQHYNRYHTLDRFHSGSYCRNAGIKLAAREFEKSLRKAA